MQATSADAIKAGLTVLPFGMWKFCKLVDIDTDYLEWTRSDTGIRWKNMNYKRDIDLVLGSRKLP